MRVSFAIVSLYIKNCEADPLIRLVAMKRHDNELSQDQQAVVVFVFRPNNGRDYGLASFSGQSVGAGPSATVASTEAFIPVRINLNPAVA